MQKCLYICQSIKIQLILKHRENQAIRVHVAENNRTRQNGQSLEFHLSLLALLFSKSESLSETRIFSAKSKISWGANNFGLLTGMLSLGKEFIHQSFSKVTFGISE